MAIGHLFDHTCDVWRIVRSLGNFHETVNSYVKVYENLDCTYQRRNTVLGSLGPGQKPTGDRRVYFDIGPLFEDNDIISLTSGPAGFVGPQTLEVESTAVPRGHHIELRCSEWSGELPTEGS